MMTNRAILISIKPRHDKNILNGIKTLEIRKKFPKDYVGWVYIYCTKSGDKLYAYGLDDEKKSYNIGCGTDLLNGKVVARFWCDKVEEIKYHFGYYDMGEWTESYILENACLTAEELDNYLQASKEYDEKKISKVYGYAIHINDLEIFDKPKEISEFLVFSHIVDGVDAHNQPKQFKILKHITRPPQSWCYIENI